MGVQVGPTEQPESLRIRVAFNDVPHGVSKIDFGAALHDQHIPPARFGSQIIIRLRTPLRLYSVS